jgi:lysophospholipase L1-like esterase
MTVCFKYAEVQPEDCVVQMSTTAPGGLFADSEGKASNEPNETFCDGLHKMCRTLLNKYKNKDIIILIPIKRVQETHWSCVYPEDTNKYGKTLNDYREALIECCEYYSIPYIDLYTLSGLNPHIDPSLFGDTDGRAVHPNAEGHRKMAAVIVAQMESMKRYNE